MIYAVSTISGDSSISVYMFFVAIYAVVGRHKVAELFLPRTDDSGGPLMIADTSNPPPRIEYLVLSAVMFGHPPPPPERRLFLGAHLVKLL